ncbi:MAG: T9SS type A sorting domain-containing protein [Flavobacteriales bacterium]|nr:T9SS type A sorting domain-containing protein [Flavobacteriales bacterium]
MTKITLSLIFGCLSLLGFSQQSTVSTGGNATGTGGSVSYSVGQIDYTNHQSANGSSNQGVQQPYEFYLVKIDEVNSIELSIYPNPTTDFLILELDQVHTDFEYVLTDMNGKMVDNHPIESAKTEIDMRTYSSGAYHLTLKNKTTTLQTINIIKN